MRGRPVTSTIHPPLCPPAPRTGVYPGCTVRPASVPQTSLDILAAWREGESPLGRPFLQEKQPELRARTAELPVGGGSPPSAPASSGFLRVRVRPTGHTPCLPARAHRTGGWGSPRGSRWWCSPEEVDSTAWPAAGSPDAPTLQISTGAAETRQAPLRQAAQCRS